jgi:hypothetical protein
MVISWVEWKSKAGNGIHVLEYLLIRESGDANNRVGIKLHL